MITYNKDIMQQKTPRIQNKTKKKNERAVCKNKTALKLRIQRIVGGRYVESGKIFKR